MVRLAFCLHNILYITFDNFVPYIRSTHKMLHNHQLKQFLLSLDMPSDRPPSQTARKLLSPFSVNFGIYYIMPSVPAQVLFSFASNFLTLIYITCSIGLQSNYSTSFLPESWPLPPPALLYNLSYISSLLANSLPLPVATSLLSLPSPSLPGNTSISISFYQLFLHFLLSIMTSATHHNALQFHAAL